MNAEQSPIDSFDVSIKRSPSFSDAKRTMRPVWNILICSDLGARFLAPRNVRASEWNEFVAGCKAVVMGTAPNTLTDDKKPLFAEMQLSSMRDFGAESVLRCVAPLSSYSSALHALTTLVEGKSDAETTATLITRLDLPHPERDRILALLGDTRRTSVSALSPKSGANSSVDRILSMIGTDAPAASSVTEKLFTAAVSGQTVANSVQIAAYIRELTKNLTAQAHAICEQPFFAERRASWNGLFTCAKQVGRSSEIHLSVVSAPRSEMAESLDSILSGCLAAGHAPDLVIWDYASTFTNADVTQLSECAAAADRYRCMLVAPLSHADPLLSDIQNRSSLIDLFSDVRFLPYKKIRTLSQSRCTGLFGPRLGNCGIDGLKQAHACWYVALSWISMVLRDSDPFAAREIGKRDVEPFTEAKIFEQAISPDAITDAAAMGITLFQQRIDRAGLENAVCMLETDADTAPYSSFLFNVLVNRVARQAGIVLANNNFANKTETAQAISAALVADLMPTGALVSSDSVSAIVTADGRIDVVVDSGVTISGHPVRFSCTF